MQSKETEIAGLERRIDDLDAQIRMLEGKPLRMKVSTGIQHLMDERARLQAQLTAIRPYSVVHNFDHYIVAHKGNFVKDAAGDWLQFPTEQDAQSWIATQIARAEAA